MGYYRFASLRYKMSIKEKKSNANKVFKLFSRKEKEHTENTEIKGNIDIFHELFRLKTRKRTIDLYFRCVVCLFQEIKMKNRKFLIITFLLIVATLNTGVAQEFSNAGPGSIIATVDSSCNPRTTQFSIGQNILAVQFNMVSFNGGTDCTLGRPVDEKGFSIRNQDGTEIFKWFQYQENPPLQPFGLLNVLSISSGTYTLHVNGGRDAQVILQFNTINVNQQTPSSRIVDSDKDGVPDQWDNCPNTPPNSLVDSKGCPGQAPSIDTDRDGVIDIWDAEPNTPPNSYVDKNGRKGQTQLSDSDGDGVIDQWDIQPNTPPNSLVDRSGQASAASSVQSKPVQQQPQQQQQQQINVSGSAPWEIWLGRWEVVSTYTGCSAASTLTWWFEVIPQGKGYVIQVQSGHKTKIGMLSDQNLEFVIQDDSKTQITLWMTPEGQSEGTVLHPKNVKECQQGRIVGQRRFE